jgi:hypothetical protein
VLVPGSPARLYADGRRLGEIRTVCVDGVHSGNSDSPATSDFFSIAPCHDAHSVEGIAPNDFTY